MIHRFDYEDWRRIGYYHARASLLEALLPEGIELEQFAAYPPERRRAISRERFEEWADEDGWPTEAIEGYLGRLADQSTD